MTLYIFFFLLMCGVLIWVTILEKEAFPFSFYPMFSVLHKLEKVSVYRIALENEKGEIEWWKSEFYRYPEFIGKNLKQITEEINRETTNKIFFVLARKKILKNVLFLLELEDLKKKYVAFHIVERKIESKLLIKDYTVAVIGFKELRSV